MSYDDKEYFNLPRGGFLTNYLFLCKITFLHESTGSKTGVHYELVRFLIIHNSF